MQLISEQYRKLNEKLHDSNKEYGTSGAVFLDEIVKIAQGCGSSDILDYGCGKSTLAHNMPFEIKQYDPAIAKYSKLPDPADIVVCTEVLEHVEPECIEDVLKHLSRLTKKFGFFTAATSPAKKILEDGRNAHILLRTEKWWVEKIYQYFDILRFQKTNGRIHFLVQPNQLQKD